MGLGSDSVTQACCAGCRRRPFTAEDPSIGKIDQFSKMALTFEPVIDLEALQDLESPWKL